MKMSPKCSPDKSPTVRLPVLSDPNYIQTVIGKRSVITHDIEEFRGIPYAHVPGRWEHSTLRDRLPRDMFDATENGPRCPAKGGDTRAFQSYLPYPDVRRDEFECLNLFAVRPSKEALEKHDIDAETQLPVLVWIHGGGFIDGAGTDPLWDPTRLVQRSLSNKTPFIAVSINYRLGVFGFGGSSDILTLQSSDACVKGLNFGLNDQKLALIWVKRNIAAFGGDDTKITIMGHSAGGISCYLHLLQVELGTEKSLFRKAGVLSGPIGGLDLTTLEKADNRWADLCRLWSVNSQSASERLELLRRIPTKDLLDSVSELGWKLFALVVDECTIRKSNLGCVVSVHLAQDKQSDEARSSDEKVQLLISATDDEFRGFALMANWNYSKFHSLFTPGYASKEAAEEVLQAYNILPTSSNEELLDSLSQFISDSTMMHKVYRGYNFFQDHRVKQALLRGEDPNRVGVQYTHFEFGNPFSGPMKGISHHGVELIYAFGNLHHALEKADKGILQGYVDPNQAQLEPEVDEPSTEEVDASGYCKSNIDLSYEIQDRWIRFVVEDCQETDQRTSVDDILTFGFDRSVRTESWNDEKWTAKKKRLQLLDKDFDSMTAATQGLVGSVIGMVL